MTPEEIKAALSPIQALALTGWGEARSELVAGVGWRPAPVQARIDVMSTAVTRLTKRRAGATTIQAVVFARWQYSCWEARGGWDDPRDDDLLAENYEALLDRAARLLRGEPPSAELRECLYLAAGLLAGDVQESVAGATHYYAVWLRTPPAWASGQTPVLERFGHRFYAGIA